MMGRGNNKQVKNVTSSGDRYSAASSTNVHTMIKSRKIEPPILYKELLKQIYSETDNVKKTGSRITGILFL